MLRRSMMIVSLVSALLLGLVHASDAGQYPRDWRWMSFESGNVQVFYPNGYESHARYLAFRSHAWIDSLQSWYGEPTEIARVVLNPHADRGRAYAVINPTRIELPISPALDKGIRPQRALYLDRVTGHELTHVYQMNQAAGLAGLLRPVFGEAIAPVALAPDWLLEGQAIWTESQGGGGRLNSSYTAMLFRTQLAQSGAVWPLDRIAVRGGVNPPLNRAYVGGTFLFGSMGTEYRATHHISDWMGKQAAWPGFTGWTFKRAYNGRTLDKQYEALQIAWRQQLRQRMEQRYNLGYAVGEKLLDAPRTSYHHPEWTPDGELLVTEDAYSCPPRILRLYGPLKGRVTDYADKGPSSHEGIAPLHDGVVVSEYRRGQWAPQIDEQVLVRLTRDGRVVDLAEGGLRGWAPAYHPNTQQLAWIGPLDGGGMALNTATLTLGGLLADTPELVLSTRLGILGEPAWSPDGRSIALAADLGGGETVYVVDLEHKNVREVAIADAAVTWDPTFAPDGTLWVSADAYGLFDLFTVNLDSLTAQRQTRVISGALEPAVAPDGKRVAYAHYTREGFSLALLDSSRWLRSPVEVNVNDVSLDLFHAPDSALGTAIFGESRPYSPLRHLAPNYALPSVTDDGEPAYGLEVHGRDPLGMLSWRVHGRWGLESNEPDLGLTATYRDLPVNLTAYAASYPDKMLEVDQVTEDQYQIGDSTATAYYLHFDEVWRRSTDLNLLAFQPIPLDRGPGLATLTPYGGLVSRYREVQDVREPLIDAIEAGVPTEELASVLDNAVDTRALVGVRLGANYLWSNGARRDPVPGRLLSASVVLERAFPDMDLYADLVQAGARWHTPGPWTNTVIAVDAVVQAQNGDFAYSRSAVRPRGYGSSEMPIALLRNGRFLFGGGEFHFPLWYPDRGWPTLGNLFVERFTGTVFAEATTGWGGGASVQDWMADESALSVGGELGIRGWLWFQAEAQVSLGVAFHPREDDTGFYFRLSFPELYSFVNDAAESHLSASRAHRALR